MIFPTLETRAEIAPGATDASNFSAALWTIAPTALTYCLSKDMSTSLVFGTAFQLQLGSDLVYTTMREQLPWFDSRAKKVADWHSNKSLKLAGLAYVGMIAQSALADPQFSHKPLQTLGYHTATHSVAVGLGLVLATYASLSMGLAGR